MSRRGGEQLQVDKSGRYWGAEAGYPEPTIPSIATEDPVAGVTPGAHNFSDRAAAGGLESMRPADANSAPTRRHVAGGDHAADYYYDGRGEGYEHTTTTADVDSHYGGAASREQEYAAGYDTRWYHNRQRYYHQNPPLSPSTSSPHNYHQEQSHSNSKNDNYDSGFASQSQPPQPPQPPPQARSHSPYGLGLGPGRDPYTNHQYGDDGYSSPSQYGGAGGHRDRDSGNSIAPLGAAAEAPGRSTPTYNNRANYYSNGNHHHHRRGDHGHGRNSPTTQGVGYGQAVSSDMYPNDPYQRRDPRIPGHVGVVNPSDIIDDGDEGLEYRKPARRSLLGMGTGGGSSHDLQNNNNNNNNRDRQSGIYSAVPNASSRSLKDAGSRGWSNGGAVAGVAGVAGTGAASGAASQGEGEGGGGGPGPGPGPGPGDLAGDQAYEMKNTSTSGVPAAAGTAGQALEKPSDWLEKQKKGRRKWKWVVAIVISLLIAGGIACGIVFGVVLKNDDDGGGGGGGRSGGSVGGGGLTADEDTEVNGDLGINSQEIRDLMGNANLHKVFAAMDYTALNVQYPYCMHYPPSQNNITRDMAVLSQLTNTVRLYGTDCNQTQMVLHAIERLELQDTMKVWLGVWQDGNSTTNARQLAHMWEILEEYGRAPFLGVIVANEILFREEMTMAELKQLLDAVKANMTARGWDDFVVATADLGDNWTAQLAAISDAIMGNIHPFFSGVHVSEASQWTTTFWDNQIGSYRKPERRLNIIAETGWPTGGGSIKSSVAGIDELNTFMADWVCRAMDERISYFWFEAFDEPWKVRFNEPGREWEDKWGLLTINREIKEGVKIPDCGGRTVDQVDW